jgi:hypothetical protein
MSASGQLQPAPAPPPGPYESRIRQIWDDVWKAERDGGVFEPYISLAESELASFAANIPPANPTAAQDLQRAQVWHLFQSRHFAFHLERLQTYREQLQDVSHQTYDQMAKFNDHAVKSLTFAHGGIVLAALAYIQSKSVVPFGMIQVVGICSLGYLLTILGSHAVTAFSAPMTTLLMTLRVPRIEEKARLKGAGDLAKAGRRMIWGSRPLFYLSGLCLVVALYIGVSTLVDQANVAKSPGPAKLSVP